MRYKRKRRRKEEHTHIVKLLFINKCFVKKS